MRFANCLNEKACGLRRSELVLSLFVLVAISDSARPQDISPIRFRQPGGAGYYAMVVGEKGHLGDWLYQVEHVVDGKTAVLSIGRGAFEFVIGGPSTAGLVDRAMVKLRGNWEVTGTRKDLGRTLHFVEGRAGALIVDAAKAAADKEREDDLKFQREQSAKLAALKAADDAEAAAKKALDIKGKVVADQLMNDLKKGTSAWVYGAAGEYTKRRYEPGGLRYSVSKVGTMAVLTLAFTPLEFESKPAASAEKAKTLPLPAVPKTLSYEVALDFDINGDVPRFIELRGPARQDRFASSSSGPPPASRLYGWFRLLKGQ